MLQSLIRLFTGTIFVLIGTSLLILSVGMVASSLTSVVQSALDGDLHVYGLLNNVSGIVISAAVLDLGKFIFEEEVVRGRDLRSVAEVRQSLTKFMTIILIAMSLEALVMVFEVSTSDDFSRVIYPAALMATTILAMVSIGLFQWLTRRAEGRDDKTEPADETSDGPAG